MDWTAPIDAYCERLDAGFWSEPVNALSNAAFLLAALWAFARWRRQGGGDRAVLALIALVGVIALGSFLFHTFANGWSALADVLPIALFIYGFFALALHRLVGLSPAVSLGGTLAFALASQFGAPLAEPIFGSSAAARHRRTAAAASAQGETRIPISGGRRTAPRSAARAGGDGEDDVGVEPGGGDGAR